MLQIAKFTFYIQKLKLQDFLLEIGENENLQRGSEMNHSGVEISIGIEGSGVIRDFTMFSGDVMMDRIRFFMAEEREEIPNCTLPNVDGYISRMTKGK